MTYTVISKIGNRSAVRLAGKKRQYTIICNLCNYQYNTIFTDKNEAVSAATINSNRKCPKCGG